MGSEITQRPKWEIDHVLDGLVGDDVRLAAEAFSPIRCNGELPPSFIPTRDLILPDNSQPQGLPVFFEGRLLRYVRQVGVVFAMLDFPTSLEKSAQGVLYFRGATAVLLRGPATVKLAFPFRVERLPADAGNYWQDLRLPCVQFKLPI